MGHESEARTIGWLRRPEGLFRLELVAQAFECPDPSVDQPPAGDVSPTFEVPLAPEQAPELHAAWQSLAAARLEAPETLEALRTVLGQTLPAGDDWRSDLPVVPRTMPPPRPTAAHPRAFHGTKKKPPKAPAPQGRDLRPYLGRARVERRLLEDLGAGSTDPYFERHHGSGDGDRDRFSEAFLISVLPSLRGAGVRGVKSAWIRFQQLENLPRDRFSWPSLLHKLIVICAEATAEDAVGWMGHLLSFGPRWCDVAALGVLLFEMHRRSPDVLGPADVARFLELTPEERFRERLGDLFRGLSGGASYGYVESGFEIGDLGVGESGLGTIPPARSQVDPAWVDAVLLRGGEDFVADRFCRLSLWRSCGYQPSLLRILDPSAAPDLTEEAYRRWIRLLCPYSDGEDDRLERWNVILRHQGELVDVALGLEAQYQAKFIGEATYWFWELEDRPVAELSRWPLAWRLLARRAQSPFGGSSCGIGIIEALLAEDGAEVVECLLAAPEASWKHVERCSQRDNDRYPMANGLWILRELEPELALRSFAECPAALLAAVRWLGQLHRPHGLEALRSLVEEPLWGDQASSWTVARLVSEVDAANPLGRGVVPRALRRHVRGEASLKAVQIEGHRLRVLSRLDTLRCDLVRHAAQRALAAAFPEADGDSETRHALAILSNAHGNRRGLRRLLRERFAGRQDAERRHPLSRDWLRRHPAIDEELWLRGITTEGEVPGLGAIRIMLERDLLEVLKLGTYVGSCLGLGGGFMYSAAAIALDVNKQVLFARDARGQVIARQLVAISADDRLVVYQVYPQSAPREVRALFAQHDRDLAAALSVPFEDPDEAVEVELVLAREYWDDGAWESSWREPREEPGASPQD